MKLYFKYSVYFLFLCAFFILILLLLGRWDIRKSRDHYSDDRWKRCLLEQAEVIVDEYYLTYKRFPEAGSNNFLLSDIETLLECKGRLHVSYDRIFSGHDEEDALIYDLVEGQAVIFFGLECENNKHCRVIEKK